MKVPSTHKKAEVKKAISTETGRKGAAKSSKKAKLIQTSKSSVDSTALQIQVREANDEQSRS